MCERFRDQRVQQLRKLLRGGSHGGRIFHVLLGNLLKILKAAETNLIVERVSVATSLAALSLVKLHKVEDGRISVLALEPCQQQQGCEHLSDRIKYMISSV